MTISILRRSPAVASTKKLVTRRPPYFADVVAQREVPRHHARVDDLPLFYTKQLAPMRPPTTGKASRQRQREDEDRRGVVIFGLLGADRSR